MNIKNARGEPVPSGCVRCFDEYGIDTFSLNAFQSDIRQGLLLVLAYIAVLFSCLASSS